MKFVILLCAPALLLSGVCRAAGPYTAADGKPGRIEEWSSFLEEARRRGLENINSLPDFICLREVHEAAQLGADTRQYPVDERRVEVSYHDKKEHYRDLKAGDVPPMLGVTTAGEFGGTLHTVFDPASKASFELKGFQTIRGHKTARIQFQIAKEDSTLGVIAGDRKIFPAFRGECWVELDSREVVRLQLAAENLPKDSHIQGADQSIDYDVVRVGERSYWLPVGAASHTLLVSKAGNTTIDIHSTVFGFPHATAGWDKAMVLNLVKFKNYRKFESESKLVSE